MALDLFDEFYLIVTALNFKRIKYAVVGGVALSFYLEPRYTKDIDILTLPSQMDKIIGILDGLDFIESALPWTFKNTNVELRRFVKIEGDTFLPIDILVGQDPWYAEVIKSAVKVKSSHGYVKIVSVDNLIKMKQFRMSDLDKVDISNLKKLNT